MRKHFLLLGILALMTMSCETLNDPGVGQPEPGNNPSGDTIVVGNLEPVAFEIIPGTTLNEKAVSGFNVISLNDFLDITKENVYTQNTEYICFLQDGKLYYQPFTVYSEEINYNIFREVDGRPARYIAFYENYATAQYEVMSDASSDVILEYNNFSFDESAQTISSKSIQGWAVKENKFTLRYASADVIVLESEISEKEKNQWQLSDDKNYLVRNVLLRHNAELNGSLKTPTTEIDNRK